MVKTQSEEYEAIISALPDMVFVLTESGRYADILGGESSEHYHNGNFLKNLTLSDVLPKEKADWFLEKIKETLNANKLMIFEYFLAADDVDQIDHDSGPKGALRFEGRVTPLKSLRYNERAVIWVARNITERYQLEQQLKYHAEIDHLSKAYNRRKLFTYLEEAFYNFQRYNENSCFLLLDIDNFKQINDKYGHQTGDKIIRNITQLCQSNLRQTDILGRIGGDEFGIIYKSNAENSLTFAKRLNEIIANSSFYADTSVSIGIAQFEKSDYSIEQIYHRADVALYQSKRIGKNTSCITANEKQKN